MNRVTGSIAAEMATAPWAPVLNPFPRCARNTERGAPGGLAARSQQQLRARFSLPLVFITRLQKVQVNSRPCITGQTERQGHAPGYLSSSHSLAACPISLLTKRAAVLSARALCTALLMLLLLFSRKIRAVRSLNYMPLG